MPVSMYLALKAGKTSLWKRPQWLQVTEAYSSIFTGALGLPKVMESTGVAPPPPDWLQPASASAAPTAAAAIRRRRVGIVIGDLPVLD